jgi:hypothetical protein
MLSSTIMQNQMSLRKLVVITTLFGLVLGAQTAPVGAAGNTPSGPARTAFNYFVRKGLSPVQAAGIVGNLQQESGINPLSVQRGGPGRGIAQWLLHQRWDRTPNDNLASFARQHGGSANSLNTQLDFIWYELTTFPRYGLGTLRAARTIAAATRAFQDHFEACGKCAVGQRVTFAERVLRSSGTVAARRSPRQPK